MLQRGAGNGHKGVERDGVNAQLGQAHGHVKAVGPGFAHADNAARAGAHTLGLHLFQRFDLHVVAVGGADVGEIAARGFNVVVIVGHTGLVQAVQLLGR